MAGPAVVNQFNMEPAKSPPGGSQHTVMQPPSVPPEAYQTYMKIIDPDGIFLNKLSRLLYSAYLVKSNVSDENSPIPGYSLVEIGGKKRKTLMNWEGYNTITNNFILFGSEVISTTEFDTKELDLRKICVNGVWSIIFQLVRNWEEWEFSDETEIIPLGTSLWLNIYAVSRRSTGGGKMLSFLTDLFKYLAHPQKDKGDDSQKVRFWGQNGNT